MNMGLGSLGLPNLLAKRNFRWTFEVTRNCNGSPKNIGSNFVQMASRPNLTIEETEINYLNGKMWIPGKASWETITVTYLDIATRENQNLFNWLAAVYNFTDSIKLQQGSIARDYQAEGKLIMYDGCGEPLERWTLGNMWPTSINFGELDMSSSEIAKIELTLRYSNVSYESLCPGFKPEFCCSPCDAR